MQTLEFVYEPTSCDAYGLWLGVKSALGHDLKSVKYYEKLFSVNRLEKELTRSSGHAFQIESGAYKFRFSTVASHNLCFLKIEFESADQYWWKCWASIFCARDGFISAWLSDNEYYFWQNASDVLEYEANNKSYTHLYLVSNGLPSPLDQMEIDTSENPCRRVLKDGYIEAIGSRVWLSNKFFQKLGLSTSDFDESIKVEIGASIVFIKSRVDMFSDESSLADQKKMRHTLFKN